MVLITIVVAIITGWICAVIINYLSDTLPVYRRLQFPYCTECNQKVQIMDYVFGRPCRNCRTPTNFRFWMVNSTSIILILYLLFIAKDNSFELAINLIIYLFLILVTVIDIEHHLVLHSISLAGIVLFGVVGIITHGWKLTLIGGLAGFGIMLIFYLLGRGYGVYISRKMGVEIDEGMGFGDVNLGGVCGLLLGWPGITGGIFIGIILGGIWSLILIAQSMLRRTEKPLLQYIAYAPFITLATAGLWFMR